MAQLKLPIGIENFKKIRTEGVSCKMNAKGKNPDAFS